METEIYLTEYNETENRNLIIDSDQHSVWAYVLDSNNQIEFEGFLCSRGTLVESVENVKEFIAKDFQPPLRKNFANEFSIQSGIKNENLKIVWENNLIRISINETEFLKMDTLNKMSYSKAISEKGAYGNPLTEK
ncbi:hypothetical protein [Tenacibaculum larymnensis]|uniref:Uncharacterized protein n=1 Tax=Tenacibaculum larymnensis TaxID=2878201 RepID=A0A9X4EU66_9FLAO|nr:hypothetical protein [Tenacibaculum larymnensis]MDE1208350.1 hypothetical protein [Tenacibaculum larymnensis]